MRLLLLLIALVVALAGCGGDEPAAPESAATAPAAGPEHVHGLGVHEGAVHVATHHGLWRASGSGDAEIVGETRHDLMGFTVADDGTFLASGHPGPESPDLPPALGLIRSSDGGSTWEPVSLTGEVDFHVLRTAGRHVYGIDSGTGMLLHSRDGGATWQRRRPPPGAFDLAVSPDDPRELVAATESGLMRSRDGGGTWRPGDAQVAGLLAWPEAGALYVLDGRGAISRSQDGGRTWESSGTLDGAPEAFTADGGELYVAVSGGSVLRSSDGGRTWTALINP